MKTRLEISLIIIIPLLEMPLTERDEMACCRSLSCPEYPGRAVIFDIALRIEMPIRISRSVLITRLLILAKSYIADLTDSSSAPGEGSIGA